MTSFLIRRLRTWLLDANGNWGICIEKPHPDWLKVERVQKAMSLCLFSYSMPVFSCQMPSVNTGRFPIQHIANSFRASKHLWHILISLLILATRAMFIASVFFSRQSRIGSDPSGFSFHLKRSSLLSLFKLEAQWILNWNSRLVVSFNSHPTIQPLTEQG